MDVAPSMSKSNVCPNGNVMNENLVHACPMNECSKLCT